MTPTLTLTDVSGSTLTEAVCLSFRLEKERYTPFTTLTARFLTSRSDFGNPASVAFRLDNQLLHQGVLDGLTMTKQKGMQTVQVSSRADAEPDSGRHAHRRDPPIPDGEIHRAGSDL